MPELSSSVVSAPSDDELPEQRSGAVGIKRPCLTRSDSSRGREKHMTPVHLAKIMEDMSHSKSAAEEWKAQCARMRRKASSMPTERVPAAMAALSKSCDDGTEAKSTHSVVRGFSPSRVSSSYRSSANLAAAASSKVVVAPLPAKIATPAPKPVPAQAPAPSTQKKKQPVFFFASSPSSDGSPDESYCSYRQPNDKKTSFMDEVATRTLYDDDDSDDDEVSESAIDDDDLEWESSSESGSSSYDDNSMFKRVESRPNLIASRRSLLSTMLHEPERAAHLASVASKSTPALRRCNSPREPPLGTPASREDEVPGSKPIRRINTALHPLALSPRTTRRNMLATELTESLRKHLLWERQQKNTTASAHLKRRYTAADVTKLADYPQPRGKGCTSKNNSWNNPFDETQYEYHAAGW